MENIVDKGKFAIFSLLFSESRSKKRNPLIEPFSAAAFSLKDKNDKGKVYINF